MIAAIEQFLRDTTPPPAPPAAREPVAARRAARGRRARPGLQRLVARRARASPGRGAHPVGVQAGAVPYSITVRLAFAGGASRRGSAPVRCAVAARTQPPWVTTTASSPAARRPRGHARLQLGERLRAGRGELAALPGGDGLGVELVERVAGPVADVDLAPARVGRRSAEPERLRRLSRPRQVGGQRARRQPVEERKQRGRLLAAEGGQRRVGLALQAVLGVPGRLAVADQEKAGGHGRQHGVRSHGDEVSGDATTRGIRQPVARAGS